MNRLMLRGWQIGLLILIVGLWAWASNASDTVAFFFGRPQQVAQRLWAWFVTNGDIYGHMWPDADESTRSAIGGVIAEWMDSTGTAADDLRTDGL